MYTLNDAVDALCPTFIDQGDLSIKFNKRKVELQLPSPSAHKSGLPFPKTFVEVDRDIEESLESSAQKLVFRLRELGVLKVEGARAYRKT